MCRSRRKTSIFGCSRATCDSCVNIFDNRMLCIPYTIIKSYSNAGFIRCILVHGSRFIEGSPIIRSNLDYVHASQISTRLHVLETGNSYWIFSYFEYFFRNQLTLILYFNCTCYRFHWSVFTFSHSYNSHVLWFCGW